MKISAAISMLQALQLKHGDQDLVVADEWNARWIGLTDEACVHEAGSLEIIPVIVVQGEFVA